MPHVSDATGLGVNYDESDAIHNMNVAAAATRLSDWKMAHSAITDVKTVKALLIERE